MSINIIYYFKKFFLCNASKFNLIFDLNNIKEMELNGWKKKVLYFVTFTLKRVSVIIVCKEFEFKAQSFMSLCNSASNKQKSN